MLCIHQSITTSRRNRTRSIALLVALALTPLAKAGGFATSRQVPDSGASALIAQMELALGGAKAIANLSSLSVIAQCSGPEGRFETRVDSFRSDWVRFRQSHSAGETDIWSAPRHTWSRSADGTVTQHGARERFFVRSHEFHFLVLELSTRFSGHRVGSATTIRGRRCTPLLMEDEMGQDAMVCLDHTTRLPVVLEMNPNGATGPIRVYFDGWRTIDGVQLFGSFELTEGAERTFRYDYRTIEPRAVSALDFVAPTPSNRQGDRELLFAILRDERRAHLEADPAPLVKHLADEIVDVSAGTIGSQSKSDMQLLFARLFQDASYQRWEDTEPPRLVFSDDGTLAWTARRVEVHRTLPVANGGQQTLKFVSAYSATYRKIQGIWKMTTVTSTFAPESANEAHKY